MSIWEHRDSEPPAGEAAEDVPPAQATQEPPPAGPGHQAGAAPGEPAPALWRAYGGTLESFGRPPGQARDGPHTDSGPPGPVLAGEALVLDEETAVKDPVPGDTGQGMAAGLPGEQAVAEQAEEPAVAEQAEEPAGPGPGQEPAGPGPGQEPAGPGPGQEPAATKTAQRWSEISATFVDDPRGSVKLAADAVDSAIEEFVRSVRARQRDLASSWQGSGTGTEQLRVALLEYRELGAQVSQLSLPRPASS